MCQPGVKRQMREDSLSLVAGTDYIDILDQRALPDQTRYIRCQSGDCVTRAIRDMAVRRAPAIGVAAAYGLWLYARSAPPVADAFAMAVQAGADALMAARPTAVNVAWAVRQGLNVIAGEAPDVAVAKLRQAADEIFHEDLEANRRLGRAGAVLFSQPATVLTHCNTGSLATAGIGTALGVIRTLYAQGLLRSVYVDETRPLLQGARLTAWELDEDKIPARLITDSAAAAVMGAGKVDAVIVGADRIALNGDTANKVGTYGLAVLAQYHRIPFYVAAPVSTIDPYTCCGQNIPIEERSGEEVRMLAGKALAPADFPVYNPAFDVTPHHLISAIITDRGVLRAPYQSAICALFGDLQKGGETAPC